MCDLADLLVRRADLAADAAHAADVAADVLGAFERGEADFGDRCYYADRAYDAAADLEAFDLGAAALVLALEA